MDLEFDTKIKNEPKKKKEKKEKKENAEIVQKTQIRNISKSLSLVARELIQKPKKYLLKISRSSVSSRVISFQQNRDGNNTN